MSCPNFGPCLDGESCWDGRERTAYCWKVVWTLLSVGIALLIYGDTCAVRIGPLERLLNYLRNQQQERAVHQEGVLEKETLHHLRQAQESVILNTRGHRQEENFCKNLDDPSVICPALEGPQNVYYPINFPPSNFLFSVGSLFRATFYILYKQFTHSVILGSLGWGCVCSAVATIFWLMMSWDDYCVDYGFRETRPNTLYINEQGVNIKAALGTFVFLPTFFIINAFRTASSRWVSWFGALKAAQGTFRDLGLYCGSRLANPQDMNARKQLFKIYRYANYVQLGSLKSIASFKVQDIDLSASKGNVTQKLGLLTRSESAFLQRLEGKANCDEIVLSWLSTAIAEYFESDSVTSSAEKGHGNILSQILNNLGPSNTDAPRAVPNIVQQCLFILGDFFILTILVGFPFSLVVYIGEEEEGEDQWLLLLGTPCFQPLVLLGVAIFVASIRLVLIGVVVLGDPFKYQNESLQADYILAETDRSLFTLLRAQFVGPTVPVIKATNDNHTANLENSSSYPNGVREVCA